MVSLHGTNEVIAVFRGRFILSVIALLSGVGVVQAAQPVAVDPVPSADLVLINRILVQQGIIDANAMMQMRVLSMGGKPIVLRPPADAVASAGDYAREWSWWKSTLSSP